MNANQIALRALRLIQVTAHDEPATAEQVLHVKEVLEGLFEEATEFAPVDWTLDNIPARVASPLARLLAAEIAPDYERNAPDARQTAMIRFQAMIAPDDRPAREPRYF